MNYIDKIRAENLAYAKGAAEIPDSQLVIFSPSDNFKIETVELQDKDLNWGLTKVEVFAMPSSRLLFSFFVNEAIFYHSWVTKNSIEYLVCAEDLCGGQTIIDLTNYKIASYTGDDDGFIWLNHLLSPDETLLAAFGCGWGSPYFIMVYDFTKPMELPLKLVSQPKWTGYEMIAWIDNKRIKVKNSENEEGIIEI